MRPLVTDKIIRDQDTICALATAPGRGAIAVLRISGPRSIDITRGLANFLPPNPESHRVYYGLLRSPQGVDLDEVLLTYFAAGRSFSGEATCEISCHGSIAIVDEILRRLIEGGARPAERGEFTYRAFMNGRIDLVQAESVLGLVESRSTRATRLSLRQLKGEFSVALNELKTILSLVLAHLEANIDFASEDIVIAGNDDLQLRLMRAQEITRQLLAGYERGRILRHGFQIALVGRPNVGKSSLLNAMAREERAIVTPIAGTTRDFVEAQIEIGGVHVQLIDTAGLRVTQDPIEIIGVERTLAKLADVDLIFYVIDGEHGITPDEREFFGQIPWEKTIGLRNKSDLAQNATSVLEQVAQGFAVSAVTRAGLDDLHAAVAARLNGELSEDSTLVSNARHYRGLQVLDEAIEISARYLGHGESPDLIALELQTGLRSIYEILGLVYDDQVMDQVFAEFCLGK